MNELENVKVGAKLLVSDRFGERIEIVERVTKTLVITEHHRYRIKDGRGLPIDSWIITHAHPASIEDIERITKAGIRRKNIQTCKNIDYDKLTDGQIERIVNIIKGQE